MGRGKGQRSVEGDESRLCGGVTKTKFTKMCCIYIKIQNIEPLPEKVQAEWREIQVAPPPWRQGVRKLWSWHREFTASYGLPSSSALSIISQVWCLFNKDCVVGKASALCCFEACYYLYSQEDSPHLYGSRALFGPGVNKLSWKESGDDDDPHRGSLATFQFCHLWTWAAADITNQSAWQCSNKTLLVGVNI